MSVSSILSAVAPQYDADAARDTFISLAANRVNYTFFGKNAELAHAYMTAHMMASRDLVVKTGGFAIGSVTLLKEGDVSIGMKSGSVDSELSLTSYGQQFIALQKSSGMGIGVTGVGSFLDPRLNYD